MFASAEYSTAIQALIAGLGQLKPDGNCCAICGDSGHQAWECHHNPLVMLRELETLRELGTLRELERQYAQRLGRLAQLCATVCPWVLEHANLAEDAPEVKSAAKEIMAYVEAVRP